MGTLSHFPCLGRRAQSHKKTVGFVYYKCSLAFLCPNYFLWGRRLIIYLRALVAATAPYMRT